MIGLRIELIYAEIKSFDKPVSKLISVLAYRDCILKCASLLRFVRSYGAFEIRNLKLAAPIRKIGQNCQISRQTDSFPPKKPKEILQLWPGFVV